MKRILFFSSLCFICLTFIQCASKSLSQEIKFEAKPPFIISEASFNEWFIGRDKRSSGVDVYVVFSEISPEVEVEKIFFKKFQGEIANSEKDQNRYTIRFKNEKRDFVMSDNPFEEARNLPREVAPEFNLNAKKGVLQYKFKGRTYYYKIPELVEKPTLSYPH